MQIILIHFLCLNYFFDEIAWIFLIFSKNSNCFSFISVVLGRICGAICSLICEYNLSSLLTIWADKIFELTNQFCLFRIFLFCCIQITKKETLHSQNIFCIQQLKVTKNVKKPNIKRNQNMPSYTIIHTHTYIYYIYLWTWKYFIHKEKARMMIGNGAIESE